MSAEISEDTSKRITALRFLLMVLVVFIHNNFTAEGIAESVANGNPEILFNPNGFSVWVQLFISDGIARCAVPLFFLFAAYLQGKKADSYGTLLKKRAKSLLVPFALWTALYVFYFGGLKLIVAKIAPQLVAHPEISWLSWSPADWVHNIFGYAIDDHGDITHPHIAYQFWFLRDLMLLIIVSPIIMRAIRRFPAGFFTAVAIVFMVAVRHIYAVRMQALFFYVVGLYWGVYDLPLLEKIDRISWAESLALFVASVFVTYLFYAHNTTMYWCMVLSACLVMLKCSRAIASHQKAFAVASYLAGFSFFLYAIHTPVLNNLLQRLWLHFFPMKNAFFCLFEYFGVSLLTIAIGTGIGIALKKICPPVFRLLNGGR